MVRKTTRFTAIDNDRSVLVEKLTGLLPSRFNSWDDLERISEKVECFNQDRCWKTSHCEYPLEKGKQTLFVNASYLR